MIVQVSVIRALPKTRQGANSRVPDDKLEGVAVERIANNAGIRRLAVQIDVVHQLLHRTDKPCGRRSTEPDLSRGCLQAFQENHPARTLGE